MMEHFSFLASLFGLGHIVSAFDLSDPQTQQTLIDVIALIFGIIGPPSLVSLLFHRLQKPRKRLSYETESDVALVDWHKDLGEDIKVTLTGGDFQEPTVIDDARLIMFKLINTGAEVIHKEDFSFDEQQKIRLEFDEPKLILGSVHHTEPEDLIPLSSRQDVIKLDTETVDGHVVSSRRSWLRNHITSVTENPKQKDHTALLHKYVDLEGRTLDKDDAVVLKLVTQGHVPMRVEGHLLGGRIEPYTPPQPIFTAARLIIGSIITFVFVVGFYTFHTFQTNGCPLSPFPATLIVSGSSAFAGTAQNLATQYHRDCPLVSVNVLSSDSGSGQKQLSQGKLDIANSDVPCTLASGLTGNPAATIVFAVIVNKQVTGVSSLTQQDITNIYDGKVTNWRQFGGPNMRILFFGRPQGSGTQANFTNSVLLDKGKGVQSLTTYDTTQEELDNVAKNAGAIGYVDLSDAENDSRVIRININDVAPTLDSVASKKYVFASTEYMCTRKDTNSAALKSFISYVQNNIVTGDDFINIGYKSSSASK